MLPLFLKEKMMGVNYLLFLFYNRIVLGPNGERFLVFLFRTRLLLCFLFRCLFNFRYYRLKLVRVLSDGLFSLERAKRF